MSFCFCQSNYTRERGISEEERAVAPLERPDDVSVKVKTLPSFRINSAGQTLCKKSPQEVAGSLNQLTMDFLLLLFSAATAPVVKT